MPDLPDRPPLIVTEHRAQAVCCPGCRTRTRAAFPAAVAGPVQCGPRLEAWVAYRRYAQHLPVARLRALLREWHGVSLSTGTVETLCRRAVARQAARAGQLRAQALALPVACMDETGLRVAGALRWLHVSCDDRFTYDCLGARSAIWTEYVGIAVHDRLASYGTRLSDETAHGVCNAHRLRNLEEIVELEKAPDGWAAAMQTLLREARDTAVHACDTTGGRRPRLGTPSWRRSWTTTRACRRRPAGATAATTWLWLCGRCGTPACSSWPTRGCPSPTTGRSRPCAWPSCR